MDADRRKIIHDAMVRLSDGDRAAFDVLLDQLWPVILAFAQRGVEHASDAEDIAQEVFFRICSRIADFDRSRDGLSWAFGIAGYEIKTHRRRRQRRREVRADASLTRQVDRGGSPEDLLIEREAGRAVERAVGALTEDDRRALGLLGASPPAPVAGATLRKRKQRALERLRNVWKGIYGEP